MVQFTACGVCNGGTYKGNKFPEEHEGGPIINPCEDFPEAHLIFHYDPHTYLASVYGMTQRGKTTERLLGLNRYDLREHRSKHVRLLQALVKLSTDNSEAKALVEEAKQNNAEYAAFIRQLT